MLHGCNLLTDRSFVLVFFRNLRKHSKPAGTQQYLSVHCCCVPVPSTTAAVQFGHDDKTSIRQPATYDAYEPGIRYEASLQTELCCSAAPL